MAPRTPDFDELLKNAGWLRRLAAGLVGSGAADDLVQDTWVQAMRAPPPAGVPQGPWLAKVARNLFKMSARREEVRRRHGAAAAAATPEGAPDAEELLVRLETQRRLARIVAELDEPFRTTVLLRYYEGMSGATIARATGVPAGTVRWRLKEGLARIRVTLDATNGEDKRDWRRALLPLAQGVWIMKKTWSIVALVLLLVGLGAIVVYVARRGGGESAPRAGGSDHRPTSAAPAVPPLSPAATPPTPPAEAGRDAPLPLMPAQIVVDAKATAGAFGGRVVNWSTGRGVPGAQVTFNARGAAVTLATAADGTFAFEPQAPGRYTLQLVTADEYLPFAPAWDESPISLMARAGVRVEGLVIYLSPAIDYHATVVDPDGRPVAKATARLVNVRRGEQILEGVVDEFTADEKGQFVFHAPDFTLVEARHKDWAPGRAVLSDSALLTHEMTIRLGALGTADPALGNAHISGRVIDDEGAPVSGAIVAAVPRESATATVAGAVPHPRADDVTGDDGRFDLSGLDPGPHHLTARAEGYAPYLGEASTGDGPTVVLSSGASLTGRVLDPEGDPVPAFTLHVGRVENGMIEKLMVERSVIDPDGRFELRDLLPGPARLSVTAHGFAPATRISVEIPAPPAAGGPMEVRLPRGGRLTGRVIDRATGAPLELARVSVEGTVGDGSSAIPFASSTTTAADGTFELSGLAPGRRAVLVGAFAHHGRIIGGLDVSEGGAIGPMEIDLAATKEGEEARVEFVGIGVELAPTADSMLIKKVLPDGGAAQAGLTGGDEILAVDGVTVASVGFQSAIPLIRGPEGTTVSLTLRRAGAPAPVVVVVVVRKRLSM